MIEVVCGRKEWAESLICKKTGPSFAGIVTGQCSGKLWVNKLERPTLALAYSDCVGGYSILGKGEREEDYTDFKHFLEQELFIQDQEKGITKFEYAADCRAVQEKIMTLFKEKSIGKGIELTYVLTDREKAHMEKANKKKIHKKAECKADYVFKRVDEKFFDNAGSGMLKNTEMLMQPLLDSWKREDAFLEAGLAFVAIDESQKRVIAYILGSARYEAQIAIDIATEKEYRRQGIAEQLTSLFMEACHEEGLKPWWNCMKHNEGSKKLAENAGLSCVDEGAFFWFEH